MAVILGNSKYYLQLYIMLRSHVDATTAEEAVNILELMIDDKLNQKLRRSDKENDINNIIDSKLKQEQDIFELENDNLNRIFHRQRKILIGLFITLILLILGLYFHY
jgi:hypothetical protein